MGNNKKKLVSIKRKQYIHESNSRVSLDDSGVIEGVKNSDNQEETTHIKEDQEISQHSSVLEEKNTIPDNFTGSITYEKEIPEMSQEEKQFLSTEKISPDSVEDFNKEIRKMLVDRHNIYSSVRESFISRNSGSEKQEIHEIGSIENAYDDRNHRVVSSSKRASKAPVNRRMSYLSSNRTL